ncbi:hypothetical protein EYC80_004555 [Monilinia laxa]|uniref:RlpA-like protein double-psi beta-barrel domain-containing protein n=1 Tax=Monilinia laxa TaxID=61186 RepID=A0A5N6KH38_MONLA|nr:hypothetical protein EYC80_004555 [Monilinia laxa]
MAATVVAQPHVRHQHAARHQKRDIVWVTESEIVTETVDYTTTIYVSPGYVAPTTTSVPSVPSVTPTTLATIPKSSAAASSSIPKYTAAASSSTDAAVFNQQPSSSNSSNSTYVAPPSSTSVAAPSTTPVVVPTTSSTYVAPVVPTTSSTYVAPVVPTTSSTYVAPVVSTTSKTTPLVLPSISSIVSAVLPTTSSVTPVVVPSYTSSAPVVATSSASSSTGGVCASGSPCSGDMTFYEAGLGACGITTDGSTFAGVALPVGLMGSLSNNNPYCGKTITIKCTSTGKTTQATVIDKCMGCEGDSIDLTNFAFDQLAEESVGRTHATWYFND